MLLRELRQRGYEGGFTQLKVFINPMKRREPEPLMRSETARGGQMQVDFTTVRRSRAPLPALVATPGYSRASYVRFTADEDVETLCACLSVSNSNSRLS